MDQPLSRGGSSGVVHRLHCAVSLSADNRITNPQRPLLHEQAGNDAAALMQRGIKADAGSQTIRIGTKVVQLRNRQQHVEQIDRRLHR
jgi:hypothetical protein